MLTVKFEHEITVTAAKMNVAEVNRHDMDNGMISPPSLTFQDFFSTHHGTNVNGKKLRRWLKLRHCHCGLHHHQSHSSSVCTWKLKLPMCSRSWIFWGDSSLLMLIWPNNPSTMIEESAYELSSISVQTTEHDDVRSKLKAKIFAHFFPDLRSLQSKWKVPWYFRK